MPTLNIGGKRVKVGDEFLSLSPEQQNATVDEIAASMGGQGDSSAYETATANASKASQLTMPPKQAPAQRPVDLMTATAATINGITGSVPFLQNISDAVIGTGAQLTGGNYGETVAGLQQRRDELAQQAPISDVAGKVGGILAPFGVAGKSKALAGALGMGEGNVLQRGANFGLSGAGYAGLQGISNGESPGQILNDMGYGFATAAPIPLVGGAVRAGAGAAWNAVAPKVGAMLNPAKEAARRSGVAFGRDQKAGQTVTAADEAAAADAGVPLLNADRGGETTRALARSVANQNPEARGIIENTAKERFAGQADRAVDFIKRLTGGAVDDIERRSAILASGKATNKVAYDAARSNPKARAIWTPEIKQLMQSEDFMAAIKATERTASNDAAIQGVKAVKNPFVFLPDGTVTLRKMPDGSYALPSLEFWDVVQRNLRKMQEGLAPTAKLDRSQIGELRTKLLQSLDGAVPEFQVARQGAASFFGAENALDAGRMFAAQPKNLPEARVAFMKLNATERKDFATGYASSIIDRIKSANDGQNIIRAVFETPASREMMEMVFGAAKFRQLEAYVRVENLADRLRGAMGNSTTARQLMELGIGAGVGGASTGWDLKGIAAGAIAARGARFVGQKVDDQVMREVAKLLMSGSRADLEKATFNAAMSEKWMQALDQMGRMLEVPARAAVAVGQ